MDKNNMRKLFYTVILLFSFSFSLFAKGNAEHGKSISTTCVACHSTDGNSIIPMYPKIAGQYENYLLKQLLLYKGQATDRQSANAQIMYTQVKDFSVKDLEDLAAYFSSQKMSKSETPQKFLTKGEKLYRGGDLEKHITACAACHSPTGKGNNAAFFPRLSGQHADYIIEQLKSYRSGERKHYVMETIAKKMSDEEIDAVSHFAAGLH